MENKYVILQQRNFFRGTFGAPRGWHPMGMGTRAECESRVRSCERSIYHLAHGEVGRPEYRIRRWTEALAKKWREADILEVSDL